MWILVLHLFLCDLNVFVSGHSSYLNEIPNGYNVPNPCKQGEKWKGVGHMNPRGTGKRNPFGLDFENNRVWSSVCPLDSDRDGRTNGEELGDPNCSWSKDSETNFTSGEISHPGICEPLGSATCIQRNSWLICDTNKSCDSTEDNGAIPLDLRLQNATVPPQETTYVCKVFEFPLNGSFDIISATAIIGNSDVIHHMILYGCDENDPRADPSRDYFECFMNDETGCRSMISVFGAWGPDVEPFCLPKDVGMRAGNGGYKKLMIQYHWTNFEMRSGLTDSSGVRVQLTGNLRKYQAGMLMIGQTYLEIPPGRERTIFSGGCVSDCSQHRIKQPVNVIESFHHMHYLGQEQKVEIFRNGTKLITLSHETDYDYNRPKFFRFSNPVELLPGDYLKTTCYFNSKDQNHTVFFGLGTSDEMCFAFLTFYPIENLPLREGGCSEWRAVPLCKIFTHLPYTVDGCNNAFLRKDNHERNALFQKILTNCRALHPCLPECKAVYAEAMAHPCLKGDVGALIRREMLKDSSTAMVVAALESCREDSMNVITLAAKPTCAVTHSFASTILTDRFHIYFFSFLIVLVPYWDCS